MFNKILVTLILLLSSQALWAERWIAKCSDGQHISYMQNHNGTGYLFTQVTTPFGKNEAFPIATLQYSSKTAVSICGQILGNKDPKGQAIAQVCMNRDRQIIYIKFNHPRDNNGIQEGEFCKASIDILQEF